LFEGRRITLVHPANGRAQHTRGVKHAAGVPDGDGLAVLGVLDLLDLQNLAHRLRNAQVARRQQRHESIARFFVNNHFAKGAGLVHSGVGTRVGQENKSGLEFDGDAIGHGEWRLGLIEA